MTEVVLPVCWRCLRVHTLTGRVQHPMNRPALPVPLELPFEKPPPGGWDA